MDSRLVQRTLSFVSSLSCFNDCLGFRFSVRAFFPLGNLVTIRFNDCFIFSVPTSMSTRCTNLPRSVPWNLVSFSPLSHNLMMI